ncbi:MAG TPA: ABC transporter permease, partial [Gemmatimonadaceae bacterium]|nr:ABC transporter permease [Gemmatimonadaceae bacterium]
LSHAFWRDHFAAAPSALGGTLVLDGEPHTVVGVMPPGFTLPGLPDDDVWPIARLEPPRYRAPFFLRAVARLAPGASAEQARAQLAALARRGKAQYPDSPPEWSYQVTDLKTLLVRDIRPTVLILYGAVALILLMSVGNVANLMLARATARARELAVRTALGAGRARLAAQLVTESTLVALLGGVLALALAHAGVRLLVAMAPGELPRLHEVRVDGVVLLFTAAVALAAGLLVGVAPALALRHGALADELRGGNKGGTDSRERRRVRSALVVAEFALAIMLMVGAGLTIHSLLRLQRVQPGARADHVLVARLSLPEARYPEPAQTEAFFDQLLARVAASPGVSEVGIGMAVPPNRLVMTDPFTPEGKTFAAGESAPLAEELMVSPGYFRALGIPLARGRNFTDADREGAPPVAIVNETMARRFYPVGDAVGRWIQTGDPDPEAPKLTIVGVVPDVKYTGLDAEPAPTIYVPFKQHRWWRTMYVVVRGSGDPLRHLPAVRGAVAAVDPQVPLQEARTMDDLLFASVAEPRFRAGLLGGFGAIALLLASAGIFGVMSYTVNQRRRETGVRLALGASRGDVMRVVVGEGVRLAMAGVVLGLLLALALARTLAAVLYEVSPLDPATFAATATLLVIVGLAACAVPAYRASRTDPMIAMRGE